MNLRETIQLVQETAVKAGQVAPKFEKLAGMAPDQFVKVVAGESQHEVITLEPAPRKYIAQSLEGLCQQVTHFAPRAANPAGSTSDAAAGESRTLAVFAGEGQVKAVLSENADRRDTISMALVWSDAFNLLNDYENTLEDVVQEEFAWLLKTTLGDELTPGNFASQVKSLKFSRAVNRESEIRTGRESLGQSVLAEVSGLNTDFPDEITARVPVYSNIRDANGDEFKFDVRCAVRINMGEGKFTLRPLSGELEAAQHAADSHVAERIRKGVPKTVVVFECSAAG